MQYSLDFQYLPKDSARPIDDGLIMPIQFDSRSGFHLIPQVGDHVNLIAADERAHATYFGRVRSRLFNYVHNMDSPDGNSCSVNIVVEEVGDEVWGGLIKE